MTTSADVRASLVDTLRRDLVGPGPDDLDLADEVLPDPPSRWYLTGYLVPVNAPPEQRSSPAGPEDELEAGGDADGMDDDSAPDPASARRAFLPSSIGLSTLVDPETTYLDAAVTWGDYVRIPPQLSVGAPATVPSDEDAPEGGDADGDEGGAESPVEDDGASAVRHRWRRTSRRASARIHLTAAGPVEIELTGSDGLWLDARAEVTHLPTAHGPRRVKAVSVFVLNRRRPRQNARRADEAFAFQVQIALSCEAGFVPHQNPRGLTSGDRDDRLGDLHYRDVHELAVGHNVAAEWDEAPCRRVSSCWMPLAAVPRVVSAELHGEPTVELGMERLGAITDAADAHVCLDGLVVRYRGWIDDQRAGLSDLTPRRAEVAAGLLAAAEVSARRIADGIAALADPAVREAFVIANRAVAAAARRRVAQERNRPPDTVDAPRWRPFQLAFILLNVEGLAQPTHRDRETVDLLFFPTGGGKTEAYLGLAAFAIAIRRLRGQGASGAGLCALMRYSLRLLTLDQLGRAAAVVCALELERLRSPATLGDWPIEIGLWVGRAATPNHMGHKGDGSDSSARIRVLRFANNSRNPQPLPLERCPWCGTPFQGPSFQLRPNADRPSRLDLECMNRHCDFAGARRPLPIQAVDEPIYRRLPAFMIATLDKFAGLPWLGETANFFGGADRHDAEGFYGAFEPGRGTPLSSPLAPPDLVIQDELHLVSGPLGTMVGLYETAIDALSARKADGRVVRPKVIASTATVRQADRQIGALFGRQVVAIFPPPGPDRRDSFFATTCPAQEPAARHYLGIAVPGGSPKVLFLRATVAIMAAAQQRWEAAGGPVASNPADPYMTVVAYFNALRELGGARRIVEGEVIQRLETYARRGRVGQSGSPFANRQIQYEPVELTSRVSTADVARAKARLSAAFDDPRQRVDVALATNMISVGLDIVRLGLMLVAGQPKSAAEYIQATSRVGRDEHRPGLVIALLNVNRPRDRSHYERFRAWHESFYRAVEATSVTPFAPRALDRGLAPVAVALVRLGTPTMTPEAGAHGILAERPHLDWVADQIASRAANHDRELSPAAAAELKMTVRGRVLDLLDEWAGLANAVAPGGGRLVYEGGRGSGRRLLRDVLDPELAQLPPGAGKFRAPRSLRGVEPGVLVSVLTPDGQPLEIDEVAEAGRNE